MTWLPDKRTSRRRPPRRRVDISAGRSEILFGGNELEIRYFKSVFKEKTGLSDTRIKDFLTWATGGPRIRRSGPARGPRQGHPQEMGLA